jgi:hypothetical protein
MSSAERMRKHREEYRAKGYHLVQRWQKDTSSPAFTREARRQSRLTHTLPDTELDEWTERAAREALEDLE